MKCLWAHLCEWQRHRSQCSSNPSSICLLIAKHPTTFMSLNKKRKASCISLVFFFLFFLVCFIAQTLTLQSKIPKHIFSNYGDLYVNIRLKTQFLQHLPFSWALQNVKTEQCRNLKYRWQIYSTLSINKSSVIPASSFHFYTATLLSKLHTHLLPSRNSILLRIFASIWIDGNIRNAVWRCQKEYGTAEYGAGPLPAACAGWSGNGQVIRQSKIPVCGCAILAK